MTPTALPRALVRTPNPVLVLVLVMITSMAGSGGGGRGRTLTDKATTKDPKRRRLGPGARVREPWTITPEPLPPPSALHPPAPVPTPTPPPPRPTHINEVVFATDHLKCPVCLNLMQPPFKLCLNGHHTCSVCVGKIRGVKKCPVCRKLLEHMATDLFMEEIVKNMTVGCPDCFTEVQYVRLPSHMKEDCTRRKIRCPYFLEHPTSHPDGTFSLGQHCNVAEHSTDDILAHMLTAHNIHCHGEARYVPSRDVYSNNMTYKCTRSWDKAIEHNDNWVWTATHFGSEPDSREYSVVYKVGLWNGNIVVMPYMLSRTDVRVFYTASVNSAEPNRRILYAKGVEEVVNYRDTPFDEMSRQELAKFYVAPAVSSLYKDGSRDVLSLALYFSTSKEKLLRRSP